MSKTKIIIAALAGIVIIASAWLLAKGITNFREGEPKINVTGMAEKQITSDLIVWNLTVSAQAEQRLAAYEQFKSSARILHQYLQKHAIPASSISKSSVDISRETKSFYDTKSQQYITVNAGYNVSQTVTVRSTELNKVEQVYQSISELYNQGIDFSSSAPLYYYTKMNDLKMEMLNKASANAYERAQTIAKGSNASIGSMVSSSMGVFQIVGLNSDEDYSWGGTFNTSSKIKVASITVKTTYRVD
ncbi:MAG TPA: SIMPL domain-containing protein [Prevotella sp.]